MPSQLAASASLTRSQKEVLRAFADGQVLDCTSIISRLALTRSTVTGAIKQLLKAGLIEEVPPPRPRGAAPGRPSTYYHLRVPHGYLGAITVGRRHISVGLATSDGTLIASYEEPLAGDYSAPSIAERGNRALATLVKQHSTDTKKLLSIGLGLPGPIDSNSQLVTAKSVLPEWAGVDYRTMVEESFSVPTTVLNDATLGLIGESTSGVAQGLRNVVYLKVSTGIGAGLLTQGLVYMGSKGTVGEIGHIQVNPHGRICHCGCRGCLETVASLPAILSSLDLVLGENPSAEVMFKEYKNGNRPVVRAVLEAAREIGHAVSMVCNLLNPEMVILAGQLPTLGPEFIEHVEQVVHNSAIPPNGEMVEIVAPDLREKSELHGAIHIARRALLPASV